MKNLSIITLLLTSFYGYCQLFVSPNTYMYVNDQVVYVTQDIDLQGTSNLYLRNESQLLQGTAGVSTNKGAGQLSVFQEGTSDNFDYNYWCSPIGNATAALGNEPFGITMLNRPTGVINSTSALMLTMTALDGIASPFSIAPRWIYKYINSILYSQWILVGTASSIAAGEGFTMKGTSGTDATTVNGVQNNPGSAQRYDFRGKPNDGNINVTVGANNLTLTGNPYPSALHVNAFLLDATNVACDGIAYYWEQNKTVNSHYLAQYQGGYGTYAPVSLISNGIYVPATFDTYDGSGNLNTTGTSSGLVIERKYAPIGQGFMVKGAVNGAVTLKNSHRTYYKESGALSQFERTEPSNGDDAINQVPHIRLNAILNNQFTRQLALALLPEATDAVDRGIDAKSPGDDELPNDVYFFLEDAKYVIEGINFDVSKRIALGVKSVENTTFKFSVPEVVNFDDNQQIYIYDNADASYHNIKTGYYEVTLDAGIYNNRFEVTFMDAMLNVPHISNNDLEVLQDNTLQQLAISNPNQISLKSCLLYDIAGKRIFGKSIGSAPAYHFSTAGLSDGIYVVRIETSDGEVLGRKVSVIQKK